MLLESKITEQAVLILILMEYSLRRKTMIKKQKNNKRKKNNKIKINSNKNKK